MGGNVWIARILCEFIAGMLLCAAASRLDLTPGVRRIAGARRHRSRSSPIVAWLYAVRQLDLVSLVGASYVVVLFVPLIACLAIGTGPLHDLLSSQGARARRRRSPTRSTWCTARCSTCSATSPTTPTLLLPPSGLQRYYAELAFIPVIVLRGVAALPLLRGAGAQADAPHARRTVLAHPGPGAGARVRRTPGSAG